MYKNILIALIVGFVLIGCGGEEDDEAVDAGLDESTLTVTQMASLTINVDGVSSDWGNTVSNNVDPAGDVNTYSGLDITAVYTAKDDENIYLRVDRVGTTIPTNEYSNTWIYFHSTSNTSRSFAVEMFNDGVTQNAKLWDTSIDSSDYFTYMTLAENLVASISTNTIEVAIPLAVLSLQSEYRLTFFTHYTQNYVWLNDVGEIENDGVIVQTGITNTVPTTTAFEIYHNVLNETPANFGTDDLVVNNAFFVNGVTPTDVIVYEDFNDDGISDQNDVTYTVRFNADGTGTIYDPSFPSTNAMTWSIQDGKLLMTETDSSSDTWEYIVTATLSSPGDDRYFVVDINTPDGQEDYAHLRLRSWAVPL